MLLAISEVVTSWFSEPGLGSSLIARSSSPQCSNRFKLNAASKLLVDWTVQYRVLLVVVVPCVCAK
jgi:hypothetical protein